MVLTGTTKSRSFDNKKAIYLADSRVNLQINYVKILVLVHISPTTVRIYTIPPPLLSTISSPSSMYVEFIQISYSSMATEFLMGV